MKHTAAHGLSVSNGYGTSQDGDGNYQSVTVHCGRCRGNFLPDESWVTRYFAAAEKALQRQVDKGYAQPRALVALAEDREELMAAVRMLQIKEED